MGLFSYRHNPIKASFDDISEPNGTLAYIRTHKSDLGREPLYDITTELAYSTPN